jgi:hypothetical protein
MVHLTLPHRITGHLHHHPKQNGTNSTEDNAKPRVPQPSRQASTSTVADLKPLTLKINVLRVSKPAANFSLLLLCNSAELGDRDGTLPLKTGPAQAIRCVVSTSKQCVIELTIVVPCCQRGDLETIDAVYKQNPQSGMEYLFRDAAK